MTFFFFLLKRKCDYSMSNDNYAFEKIVRDARFVCSCRRFASVSCVCTCVANKYCADVGGMANLFHVGPKICMLYLPPESPSISDVLFLQPSFDYVHYLSNSASM